METESEKIKSQRGRSRSYPSISLGEALERIKNIYDNLGLNGQFNRESIAAGMGYSSLNGTSSRRVAALVQYGFLDRVKDLYYLSDLAKKYLVPVEDNDQIEVIQEAALTPKLFSDIYLAFNGQVMPKQFTNRLIQEFHIEHKVAKHVEKIFKSTMETAGILQANGVLKNEVVEPQTYNTNSIGSNHIGEPEVQTGRSNPTDISQPGYLSVKLPSGLIVSYSHELASEFAFGTFGSELKTLDEAVAKRLKTFDVAVKNEEV